MNPSRQEGLGPTQLFLFPDDLVRPSDGSPSTGVGRSDIEFLGPTCGLRPPRRDIHGFRCAGKSVWVPASSSAKVRGHRIGGLVYVGNRLTTGPKARLENSLVNPALAVRQPLDRNLGPAFPNRCPSYQELSPIQRFAYLEWLGSDRSADVDIRCVLLYFFGLERRLFVDRPGADECSALVAEVTRLQRVYGGNAHFRRLCREFLDAAAVLDWDGEQVPVEPQDLLAMEDSGLPLPLKVSLGRKLASAEPLGSTDLLNWWLALRRSRLRKEHRRAFGEFAALFALRFAKTYPEGWLGSGGPRLHLVYRAASRNFERDLADGTDFCVDVTRMHKPLAAASAIAEECLRDLGSYFRDMRRGRGGLPSAPSPRLLPKELAASYRHPGLEHLREWALERISHDRAAVTLKSLWGRAGISAAKRLTRVHLIETAALLANAGIGFAPDPRLGAWQPCWTDKVVLFHWPTRRRSLPELSSAYRRGLAALRLGAHVVRSDGTVSSAEIRCLEASVTGNSRVTDAEKSLLRADLRRILDEPSRVSTLKRTLNGLSGQQLRALGDFVLAAAGASGAVAPAKVKAVQQIFRALGLPGQGILAALHAQSVESSPPARPATPHSSAAPSGQAPPQGRCLELDQRKISEIAADTRRVSAILSNVFEDTAPAAAPAVGSVPNGPAPGGCDGLDAAHGALVVQLLQRPSWSNSEFSSLVQRYGLMAGGALEALNEWAFDRYGEALLEDDSGLTLNAAVVEVLRCDGSTSPSAGLV